MSLERVNASLYLSKEDSVSSNFLSNIDIILGLLR